MDSNSPLQGQGGDQQGVLEVWTPARPRDVILARGDDYKHFVEQPKYYVVQMELTPSKQSAGFEPRTFGIKSWSLQDLNYRTKCAI